MDNEYKLIVAGGRDFNDYERLDRTLLLLENAKSSVSEYNFTVLIIDVDNSYKTVDYFRLTTVKLNKGDFLYMFISNQWYVIIDEASQTWSAIRPSKVPKRCHLIRSLIT